MGFVKGVAWEAFSQRRIYFFVTVSTEVFFFVNPQQLN
jgi:hypothetical protein